MQRHGNEMDARADSLVLQLLDELITIDLEFVEIEAKHVEMPSMPAIVPVERQFKLFEIGKSPVVSLRKLRANFDETFELSELMDPDRGLYVCQVIFKPRIQHFVVCRHHPTFASSQILGGVKAENGSIAVIAICRITSANRRTAII